MSSPYTEVLEPGNPVGIGQVVKMEYWIGYGLMDTGPTDYIAWTESYKEGITLSDIQWGFVNTGTQKGNEITGKISFTLHDIAGTLFNKYMHLKHGIDFIYFIGPDSTGAMWSGIPALFQVEPENCSLEFSQTQGFTYTISGISAFSVARSKQIVSPSKFDITGVTNGTGNTFEKVLKDDLTKEWNNLLKSCKKPTAEIEIICDRNDVADYYFDRTPVTTDTKTDDGKEDTFQYSITQNTSISDAITGLWHNIFSEADDANLNTRIRVDFKKWEGSKIQVVVQFTDFECDDALINPMKICVGSDKTCADKSAYRGEIASINLNDITNKFLRPQEKKPQESGNTSPKGSEKSPPASCPSGDRKYPIDHSGKSGAEMPWHASGFDKKGEGDKMGYWGQMYDLIQKNNATPLEIEINMAYTSAFTPEPHDPKSAKLKPGLKTMVSTIDLKQGADFKFFWYKDPDCAELIENPIISGTYRISEVNHQIGLSGNQTVVKLSHLQLGD